MLVERATNKSFSNNVFMFCKDPHTQVNAEILTRRGWDIKDIANINLIHRGLIFAKDMWDLCVSHFNIEAHHAKYNQE